MTYTFLVKSSTDYVFELLNCVSVNLDLFEHIWSHNQYIPKGCLNNIDSVFMLDNGIPTNVNDELIQQQNYMLNSESISIGPNKIKNQH